ncbi:Hypothetical predicted protein [Pelobates cultripes]|uniref:Uncharacterized protein n=1 Tax=Pelobates cultripes TaxID=61616 RepID=A0AAD1SHF7_PELCU|nr:Hypothetical predicted protein [Pelobates cultripes]
MHREHRNRNTRPTCLHKPAACEQDAAADKHPEITRQRRLPSRRAEPARGTAPLPPKAGGGYPGHVGTARTGAEASDPGPCRSPELAEAAKMAHRRYPYLFCYTDLQIINK